MYVTSEFTRAKFLIIACKKAAYIWLNIIHYYRFNQFTLNQYGVRRGWNSCNGNSCKWGLCNWGLCNGLQADDSPISMDQLWVSFGFVLTPRINFVGSFLNTTEWAGPSDQVCWVPKSDAELWGYPLLWLVGRSIWKPRRRPQEQIIIE